MSTTPRVPSAIPGEAPDFGSVLAHQPQLAQSFGRLYARFWQDGSVGQRIKEITRIRNARLTDCGF